MNQNGLAARIFVGLVVSGLAGSAYAQQPAPTGTVVGTITFGDTQRPARFASVTLTPVKSDSDDKGLAALSKKDADANPMAAMGALMGGVTMLSTKTGLDGRYELDNVAPGDYYVLANVPGYASSAAMARAPGDLSGAPVVHVTANNTVRGDESLTRGGVISGTVSYEDGSPVTAAVVTVEPAKKPEKPKDDDVDIGSMMTAAMSGGIKIAVADDLGHYRIAGLPAGEYHVQATLSLSGGVSMRNGVMDMNSMKDASKMVIYAPATLHEADATKITVKPGETNSGVDILVDLVGMHSVSGTVASAVDHHLLNSGEVTLTDTTDKQVTRTGAVAADGSFTVMYVPSGTYTLKVSDAADTAPAAKKKPTGMFNFQQDKVLKSYEDASQPEIVSDEDVTGVNIELKESSKVKQQPDLSGLFGGAGSTEKP